MKLALALILLLTSLHAADDLPEPQTSWKYPPEMTGSRVEVYRTVGDVKLRTPSIPGLPVGRVRKG